MRFHTTDGFNSWIFVYITPYLDVTCWKDVMRTFVTLHCNHSCILSFLNQWCDTGQKKSVPILGDLLQCYKKKRGMLKWRNVFVNSNACNAYISLNPYYVLSSFTTVVARIFVSRSILPKFPLHFLLPLMCPIR
jgi:hypothetical protein